LSFRVAVVGFLAFSAGGFTGFFWVVVLFSPSVAVVFPLSNRTLRTCETGGDDRGGVAVLDVICEDAAGCRETMRRVSCCGDDDPEDSLRVLFWRLLLVGEGDRLSEGVDAPDPIGVVSSSESLSTNLHDLYLELRSFGGSGSSRLASSMSAAVAGVPSGRQLCFRIR